MWDHLPWDGPGEPLRVTWVWLPDYSASTWHKWTSCAKRGKSGSWFLLFLRILGRHIPIFYFMYVIILTGPCENTPGLWSHLETCSYQSQHPGYPRAGWCFASEEWVVARLLLVSFSRALILPCEGWRKCGAGKKADPQCGRHTGSHQSHNKFIIPHTSRVTPGARTN